MRLNFKKITALATSALLTGMTLGVAAAAAFPTDFTSATPAIVYGASAAPMDQTQANSINTYLAGKVPGSVSVEGESFLYEKAQDKLTMGKGTLDVISTSLDDGELPTLLADGKYRDNDNDEFDYTQKIDVANQTLTLFDDNDYKEDTPTVGIKIGGSTKVLNYTLDFTDTPLWEDLSNSNINLLGRSYYVSQTNTTSGSSSLTLLDSSAKVTLNAGETKSLTVNGMTYEVTPAVFDTTNNKVSLIVNGGEPTNLLSSGNVESLGNNVYIGVETVVANAYQGGTQYVEVSIGSGKIELIDGQQVKINDDTVDGMTTEITLSTTQLDRINIIWSTSSDEVFLTEESSATMPSFSGVKLVYAGMEMPAEEELKVVDGSSDYIKLDDFPLEEGNVDLPLLYYNDSNFTIIGKDADERVLTSDDSVVTFDGDYHDYMVATWATTNDAESYIIRASGFSSENSYATNKTSFEYLADGSWKSLDTVSYTSSSTTDEVSIGSLVLTTGAIDYAAKTVAITAGTNVNFNTLYSKEGMKVTLPVTNVTATTLTTAINYTSANAACLEALYNSSAEIYNGTVTYNLTGTGQTTTGCSVGPSTYNLVFTEEDRNGDLAQGATITVTLGGEGTSNEVSAHTVAIAGTGERGGGTNRFQTGDNTKIYVSYAFSDLGTKVLEDENDADRETVTLVYHGGETYGKFYVAEASATTGEAGSMVFTDAEKTSWQNKNVILVGGSCINTATAEALGVSSGTCAAAFTTATGVGQGQWLIQSVADKFASGKVALVVAGYSADDTAAAASTLINKPTEIDTTAGNKYIGVVANGATSAFSKV